MHRFDPVGRLSACSPNPIIAAGLEKRLFIQPAKIRQEDYVSRAIYNARSHNSSSSVSGKNFGVAVWMRNFALNECCPQYFTRFYDLRKGVAGIAGHLLATAVAHRLEE